MSIDTISLSLYEDAACKGTDLEIWDLADDGNAAYAKTFCTRCPVRELCLERAMADENALRASDRFGVAGGLDRDERYALYRERIGNPLRTKKRDPSAPRRHRPPCSIADCTTQVYIGGLCWKHRPRIQTPKVTRPLDETVVVALMQGERVQRQYSAEREEAVRRHHAAGLNDYQIAAEMRISRQHVVKVRKRLALPSQRQLREAVAA